MKKEYVCNLCDTPCKLTVYWNESVESLSNVTFCSITGKKANWQEVEPDKQDEAKAETKLPKLTAEVFDRPDCPSWAKFAAIDANGDAWWFEGKPIISDDREYWIGRLSRRNIEGIFDSSDWKNSLIERTVKLTDWIKVGAWVWNIDCEVYGKIEKIEDGMVVIEECKAYPHRFLQARLRIWTFDEAPVYVKVKAKDDGSKSVLYLNTEQEPFISHGACNVNSFDTALELYEQLDGSPCGVLEHKNEQGAWVK